VERLSLTGSEEPARSPGRRVGGDREEGEEQDQQEVAAATGFHRAPP
jgi:hypothetical protein